MLIAVLVCVYVAWFAAIYVLVGDRDRSWQFGTRPTTPGEALTSTEPLPARQAVAQLEPQASPTPDRDLAPMASPLKPLPLQRTPARPEESGEAEP